MPNPDQIPRVEDVGATAHDDREEPMKRFRAALPHELDNFKPRKQDIALYVERVTELQAELDNIGQREAIEEDARQEAIARAQRYRREMNRYREALERVADCGYVFTTEVMETVLAALDEG